MRKVSIAATMVLVLLAGVFVGGYAASAKKPANHQYIAVMTPSQQVPAVNGNANGLLYATLKGPNFCWHFTYTDLSGVPDVAHFHPGATGETGDSYFPINPTSEPQTGCRTTAELATASVGKPNFVKLLNSNRLYFNVHTAANTAGEIRGQVLKVK